MAIVNFLLPDLGEGLTEARIVRWSVAVGDDVRLDQKLGELETDKAVTDIPSPVAGRVTRLAGEPGDTVAVGAVLVEFDAATPTKQTPSDVTPVESRGSVGAAAELVGTGAPPDAAPARRRRGVAHSESPVLSRSRSVVPTKPKPASQSGPPSHLEPLTGYRAAAVPRLEQSAREIPRAAASLLADASGLDAMRTSADGAVGTERLSEFVTLVGVVVEMLQRHPRINAAYVPATGGPGARPSVRMFEQVDLAVAVDTPLGLAVPVIHQASSLTAVEIGRRLGELAAAARAHHLSPVDVTGGTFTVTNHGRFGTDDGLPIINPPGAAILAVGRFAERPAVVNGVVVARRTVPLTLVFDHRVIDGADAARFLTDVAGEIGSG